MARASQSFGPTIGRGRVVGGPFYLGGGGDRAMTLCDLKKMGSHGKVRPRRSSRVASMETMSDERQGHVDP